MALPPLAYCGSCCPQSVLLQMGGDGEWGVGGEGEGGGLCAPGSPTEGEPIEDLGSASNGIELNLEPTGGDDGETI